MKCIGYLLSTIKIGAGLFSIWSWYKIGFKCPKYIHVLAMVGLMIGLWLAVTTPKDAPINQAWLLGKWWSPIVSFTMVYFFWGFFGGAKALISSGENEKKSSLDVDGINLPISKEEIVEIIREGRERP